ncbi:MAG: hypothetical protein KFF49_01680 [Bacteroidales bacterium]|nr:hypothetical protein [Bacteroidales bacterium]
MKKQIPFLINLAATLALVSLSANSMAQDTDCCARRAVIRSCSIDDPMGMMGTEPAGPVEEPLSPPDSGIMVIDNISSMTLLDPEGSFCRSVKTLLIEILTRDCFHIQDPEGMARNRQAAQRDGWSSQLKPSNPEEPEYSFDVEMVSGLDEYTDEGRPVRSKITVELYFDGEQRELVHRWIAYGTWDTVSNSGNSSLGLFNKLDASLRDGPDIIELLERFEKRPVDCRVDPEKEELDAGEVIDIEISDFTDVFGEKSREFNRLVVHAYSGEIVNGEPCEIGPDYRVFKVDNGTVKVKYRASTECNETVDRLTVYSSCEILPEDRCPINETNIKERVIEKNLKIKCYDASIMIKKQYDRILRTSGKEIHNDGSCVTTYNESHDINESIEASVSLSLKLEQVVDMPIMNQTWEYYKPVSVSLGGFSYSYIEKLFDASNVSGASCSGGHETNVDRNRNLGSRDIADKEYVTQNMWMLVIDNESGKALKIIPAGYNIEYDINELETINGTVHSNPPKKESSSSNREMSRTFKLGPVGEEIPDPTIKKSDTWMEDYLKRQGVDLPPGVKIPTPSNEGTIKNISPDILVKTGDGISSFGGRGENTVDKEIVNGTESIREYYTWTMRRNKR